MTQQTTDAAVLLHPVERLLQTPGLTTGTLRAIKRDLGLVREEQPCALTLDDLPSPCARCGATDDGKNGECPCDG